MNIKEFFEPARDKIALLILFIIVFSILPAIPCQLLNNNGVWKWNFCILIAEPGTFLGPLGWKYLGLPESIDQYITLLIIVGFAYLISCLIILIYQKIKTLNP